jgi:hypothetical protein
VNAASCITRYVTPNTHNENTTEENDKIEGFILLNKKNKKKVFSRVGGTRDENNGF